MPDRTTGDAIMRGIITAPNYLGYFQRREADRDAQEQLAAEAQVESRASMMNFGIGAAAPGASFDQAAGSISGIQNEVVKMGSPDGKLDKPKAEHILALIQSTYGKPAGKRLETLIRSGKIEDINRYLEYAAYYQAGAGTNPGLLGPQAGMMFTDDSIYPEIYSRSLTFDAQSVDLEQEQLIGRELAVLNFHQTKLGELNDVVNTAQKNVLDSTGRVVAKKKEWYEPSINAIKESRGRLRELRAKRADVETGIRTKVREQRALLPGQIEAAQATSAARTGAKIGTVAALSGLPVETVAKAEVTRSQPPGAITKSEMAQLRDRQTSTKSFVDTVGDALTLLNDNPDINTFVARAAGITNSLLQEGKAIARQFNIDFDESLVKPETFDESFTTLGIQNSRMRSLITSLAFRAAAAAGQTGQTLSNRDIERFIGEIGAGASDPQTFATTLLDMANRSVRDFESAYEIRMNKSFEGGDLGLSEIDKIFKPKPKEEKRRFKVIKQK
jgi:hypothetical protein